MEFREPPTDIMSTMDKRKESPHSPLGAALKTSRKQGISPVLLRPKPASPRPVTGYTTMGSPIYNPGRPRSHSLGTTPYGMPIRSPMSQVSPNDGTPFLSSSLPTLPDMPPEPSLQQKAMENAAAAERKRAHELEEKEKDMTADELRAVLKRERARAGRIAADLAALRSANVQSQLEAEMIEEGRINTLMRRLDDLQQEKGRIIVELEREEEMLTNTLQKKLDQVRREKAALEKQIEHESKSHSNLQQKLDGIRESEPTQEPIQEEDGEDES